MDSKIFTENGRYLMLAFDHRESFKKFINPNSPQEVTYEEALKCKTDIISSVKDLFSGILIDPNYGLEAYRSLEIDKPYLLPIEESGYQKFNDERINVLTSSASELKEMGASGVKILIYFNPDLESSKQQLQTAKKALEDAHANNLPFFLEIVTYDIQEEDKVFRSVECFLNNDVLPDVFKIEFPGSDYICKKITNILGVTPWIMLTRGADYTLFREQLQIASENGCRGFLAGRSLWQEYFDITDPIEKEKFLTTTLPLRFEEIKKISSDL